jgi:hypothetical protein
MELLRSSSFSKDFPERTAGRDGRISASCGGFDDRFASASSEMAVLVCFLSSSSLSPSCDDPMWR